MYTYDRCRCPCPCCYLFGWIQTFISLICANEFCSIQACNKTKWNCYLKRFGDIEAIWPVLHGEMKQCQVLIFAFDHEECDSLSKKIKAALGTTCFWVHYVSGCTRRGDTDVIRVHYLSVHNSSTLRSWKCIGQKHTCLGQRTYNIRQYISNQTFLCNSWVKRFMRSILCSRHNGNANSIDYSSVHGIVSFRWIGFRSRGQAWP